MRYRRMIPWIALIITAIPMVWILLNVENWGRDFSQNVARTDATGKDVSLHPITSASDGDHIAKQIIAWSNGQSLWNFQSQEITADGRVQLHLVRTTRMLRFKDDIRVTLRPLDTGGTLIEAESRSRVGKGDLGQNPRNLRELLGFLRQVSGNAAPQSSH